MKVKTFIFAIVSLFSASSCSQKSENYIHIYYNAKYILVYAAYNSTYKVDSEPAYFKGITGSTDCTELFDLKNSYCVYRTEVVDNKPFGTGEIKICFKDPSLETFHKYFEYYSDYDRGYGGKVHYVGEQIDEITTQHVRGKYWWTRMDCTLSQLDNKRVILEFGSPTAYDDLDEFEDNTLFS